MIVSTQEATSLSLEMVYHLYSLLVLKVDVVMVLMNYVLQIIKEHICVRLCF